MWYVLLFLGVVLYLHPQILLQALFYSAKLGIQVWSTASLLWHKFDAWKKRVKRNFFLKTRKFDDRPVMQPPSLQAPLKKRF